MSGKPEKIVRDFFAAWAEPKPDELGGFFHAQVHNCSVGGNPVSSVVMAVFELDAGGRITQWREAYDLKSALHQIQAAVRPA